jgi:hypothetical protein
MLAPSRNWRVRAASVGSALLGIWLIASPWVFAYGRSYPALNGVVTGTVLAALATARLFSRQASAVADRARLLLACWTIVSPWASAYAANKPAAANNLMVGILLTALALWGAQDAAS